MKKVFKKIMAMGIATLLGLGTIGMIGVSAATTGISYDVELLANGNFDAGTTGWEDATKMGAVTSEQTIRRGNTGSSLKFELTDAHSSVWANNRRINPAAITYPASAPGYTEITGYFHIASLGSGSKLAICAQRSFSNNAYYDIQSGSRLEYSAASGEGNWQYFRMILNTSDTSKTVFYLNIYLTGTGTVYFDDFSVKHRNSAIVADTDAGWDQLKVGSANYGARGTTFGFDNANAVFAGNSGMYLKFASGGYNGNPRAVSYPLPDEGDSGIRNYIKSNTNYRFSLWFKPTADNSMPYIIFGKGTWNVQTGGTNPELARYATLDCDSWKVLETREDGWMHLEQRFKMPQIDTTQDTRMVFRSITNNSKYFQCGDGYYDEFCLTEDYEEALSVKNASGAEITDAKVGDTIQFSRHILSEKTQAEGGTPCAIMMAAYDASGILKCVDIKTADGTAYVNRAVTKTAESVKNEVTEDAAFTKYVTDAEEVILTYTVPEKAKGCTIKAFCLNGINSLELSSNICNVTINATE